MEGCKIPPIGEATRRRPKNKGRKPLFKGEPDLTEDQAVAAARQCLGLLECSSCDLCQLFCPELCITREEETGLVRIDLDYCKGCGICAAVCPKGAIRMVLEEKV
jgi:2-oxoacid:acceptor oxidoreductase delta subunit (pyruvate/2-ketoisovalerate family)